VGEIVNLYKTISEEPQEKGSSKSPRHRTKDIKWDVTEIGLDLCDSRYGPVMGHSNIMGILLVFFVLIDHMLVSKMYW
jgi:hypothetical protein